MEDSIKKRVNKDKELEMKLQKEIDDFEKIIVDNFTQKQLELMGLDVNKFTQKKNGLTYLSWATAWGEFLKVFPKATYHVKKDINGNAFFGNPLMGYMVYTTITAMGIEREMWLFVKDGANKALKDEPYTYKGKYGKEKTVEAINMFDVNTCVMRCFAKNMAMFGEGLYIYKGEDIPQDMSEYTKKEEAPNVTSKGIVKKGNTITPPTPMKADTKETVKPSEEPEPITDKQKARIHILFKDSIANKENIYEFYGIKTCSELSKEDADTLISTLVIIKNDSKGKITQIQIGQMAVLLKQKGFKRVKLLEKHGLKKLDDMTCLKANEIIIGLRKLADKK